MPRWLSEKIDRQENISFLDSCAVAHCQFQKVILLFLSSPQRQAPIEGTGTSNKFERVDFANLSARIGVWLVILRREKSFSVSFSKDLRRKKSIDTRYRCRKKHDFPVNLRLSGKTKAFRICLAQVGVTLLGYQGTPPTPQ